jgi:hypothetical protein
MAFRELLQWLVSPDALVRWLKRYQQRKANGDGKNEPKKPGRPWISQKKVDAILRFYDAGLTGMSRIVGEMGIVSPGPRSASVVAMTDCEFVEVDEKRFQFLVQQTPFFATQVMRVMAERLRKVNQLVAPLEDI